MRLERLDFLHRINVPIITPVYVAPVPYAGPGDVVGSAKRWWGLRAYSLAGVGANAVRLRRDSDNAEQDFVTITGGGLDLASITSFKGAANLRIVKMYDQSGNSSDFAQTTAANQPGFILSGFGSHPVGRIDGDTVSLTSTTAFGASELALPITYSWVGKRTVDPGNFRYILCTALSGTPGTGFAVASNTVRMHGGSNVIDVAGATENTFHAVQAVFNNTSSDLNVNGTANTPGTAIGTNTGNTENMMINIHTGVLRCDFFEFGVWPSGFSSTQSSNMSANQHGYWGF